jgi:hypothetical protein
MIRKSKELRIRKTKQGNKAIICNLEKMNLQIYNQWGEKVYDSNGLTIGGIALLHVRK